MSGYCTIEVEVMAVNDAGSRPSATATITSEHAIDDGVNIGTEPSATESKQKSKDTSQSK